MVVIVDCAEHLGAGTLPYMAPELLASIRVGVAGAVTATNRVDIYAMAMIMWEMLAGRIPWGHMVETALIAAVRIDIVTYQMLLADQQGQRSLFCSKPEYLVRSFFRYLLFHDALIITAFMQYKHILVSLM
jgi:serine/threonine protein kinase